VTIPSPWLNLAPDGAGLARYDPDSGDTGAGKNHVSSLSTHRSLGGGFHSVAVACRVHACLALFISVAIK
jgi:hypothetical protein